MISGINITRIFILLMAILIIFSLIASPSFILAGMVLGFFAYLLSTFEFKRLFSYLGLWSLLLIQCIILIYVICYLKYDFYDLLGFLGLIISQILIYIFAQPMFHVLLCKLQK
jgi:hypothetical protein